MPTDQTRFPAEETLIAQLEATGRYRILRRLDDSPPFPAPPPDAQLRLAAFVDLETTSLQPESCEVIEIAIVRFEYCARTSQITRIVDSFDQLNQPSGSIPAEVSKITRITDAMVRGQKADLAAASAMLEEVDIVVAHNAAFDRPVLERLVPIAAEKAWACSQRDIPWLDEGCDSGKLAFLGMSHGFYYEGHRAENDCRAGIVLLAQRLAVSGRPALAVLLDSARRVAKRVWAVRAPFEMKDVLKENGYRWFTGSAKRAKCWWKEVEAGALEAELAWLGEKIYFGPCQAQISDVDATVRYSLRL
ncbi:MAG: 3'-5' exonuclease [Caulobacter sp.]|nr:3'-5' exonuclease [Caulobacter sp.]